MDYVKYVNRENLKIARENIGLDTLSASGKVTSTKKDVVSEWENGLSLPTWSQIIKLAKTYDVSEFLLLSEKIIKKNESVHDYRMLDKGVDKNKIKRLINLVISRQRWLEQILKGENRPKNLLQGIGKNIKDPEKLAHLISERLKISNEEIKEFKGLNSKKKVLDYLFKKAENEGIFVGKTISYHKLSVEDMRGLFVSNDYCPYIIINRNDSQNGQIFSFIHELAHLFRRSDSISNSLEFRNLKNINSEEIFCNKVAIELLLPKKEFTKTTYDGLDIRQLSDIYKVSEIALFYRLKELGKIDPDSSFNLENQIRIDMASNLERKKELMNRRSESETKGGPNYIDLMRDSNGELFNKFVAESYLENRISYVEASNLLRFSVEKI